MGWGLLVKWHSPLSLLPYLRDGSPSHSHDSSGVCLAALVFLLLIPMAFWLHFYITLHYPPELCNFVSPIPLDSQEIHLYNINMMQSFIYEVIETLNNHRYNFASHSTWPDMFAILAQSTEDPQVNAAGPTPLAWDGPSACEYFPDSISLKLLENLLKCKCCNIDTLSPIPNIQTKLRMIPCIYW